MFYTLCTTIFLLAVLSGWGQLISLLFKVRSGVSILLLNGIIGVNLLLVCAGFFIPLIIYVEIIVLAIGLFLFLYFKNYLEFKQIVSKNWNLWPICGLSIFAASYYPFILDHFGYYVPTINVLKSFGLVKGIANLDLILGQMSFWHILAAGFSNFADPFLRINVVALIIYIFYAFERKNFFHLVFIPVFLLFVQSPSPDLPVLMFSLILVDELMQGNKNISWLFALACYIFCIKPTMLWAPLVVIFYLFSFKNSAKFTLGISIMLLFIIKNIWCFGYPVFPVELGNFGVSWKPNQELMQASAQTAIMKTYDMQYSFQEIQHFSTWDYIWNWLTLRGIKAVINSLFIITLLILFAFTIQKKLKIINALTVAILIKSIAVLFFSAQYRFFLDVFFVVAFIILYAKVKLRRSRSFSIAGSVLVITALTLPTVIQKLLPSFRLGFFMKGFEIAQLYKPSEYKATTFKIYQVGNLKFNVAENYPFSYETPAPAISPSFINDYLEAGIFPQLIGSDLKSGVMWKKIGSSEQNKIKHILKEIGYKKPKNQP